MSSVETWFWILLLVLALPAIAAGGALLVRSAVGPDVLACHNNVAGFIYRVIGVVEPQGTLFGFSMDKFLIRPYTAPGRRHICPINVLDQVSIKPFSPDDLRPAMAEVEALMRIRRQKCRARSPFEL